MHTQKPCSGGTIELNYIVYRVNFRLLVKEEAKIHRSHEIVFNGLVVGIIYTMWFNSIVPPLHGFCVCVHDKQPEFHCIPTTNPLNTLSWLLYSFLS
jgi:hypothetical protein